MSSSTNMINLDFFTNKERNALKEYQKYKKLRTVVVRPVRAFNDTEAILKDLHGEELLSLREENDRSKKSRTKTITKPKLKRLHVR